MRPARKRSLLVLCCVFGATAGTLRAQSAEEPPASGVASAFSERNAEKAEAAPVDDRPSRPLKRNAKPTRDGEAPNRAPLFNSMPELGTVAASLALVLSLFFVVAWMMKKNMPKSAGLLPREVVQVLGRSQLSGKQFVHLVRCGNKLLLVSVTPGGAETLTEITDPLEVDRIAGLCAQRNPQSATAAFQDVLQQLSRERSHG
jgi:flagellar biogenesis protein FliO